MEEKIENIVELSEEETSMEIVKKDGIGTKIINGVKKHKGKLIAGCVGLSIGIIGTAKVLLNGPDEDSEEAIDFETETEI